MSNLSLTRSNFLFLFRSFLYNFTLDNSNLGKSSVLKSKTWNLFQNKRVNTLSLLFCHPSSNSLSIPVYINQALLINSFFFFSKHQFVSLVALEGSWSEVCMILAFPPHPFAYFLTFGYLICFSLLRTPFDFPRRFELSGVDCVITKYTLYVCKWNFWHGQGRRNPSTPMERAP